MKKRIFLALVVVALLVVSAAPALALWYYVDAEYGGPLAIELDGNPAGGQTFNVGDTITITGDLDAYAAMCAGTGNEAYTDAALEVSGPSGSGSDTAGDYDFDNVECAEVWTIETLTVNYVLTTLGMHTVYMRSYAEAASWWAGVDVDDLAEDLLTFQVVLPVIVIDGCDTGVTDQLLDGDSTISEKIAECEGARNHGQFVRCVAQLTNDLKRAEYITGQEKGAIQSCAAQADIP